MKTQRIIIGGGIGGLATALALRQRGIRADVFEQASTIREVGAGLVLSPNALSVLDQLGLGDAVKVIGWPLTSARITEADGRPVQTVDVLKLTHRYGYGMLVVHRGKLQKLLLDALPNEQIHTGKPLANFTDDGHRVRATFADGSVADGDFLIGADGIRSVVRTSLSENQTLRYAGQTCWRAMVDYTLPTHQQTTSVEYWGRSPGLRFGIVPAGTGQVYLYVTTAASANGRDVPGEVIAYLRSLSRDFAPIVRNIIDATDEKRLHRADLYDLPTLRTWSRGRVTLLGDAAHATTPNLGQGACQAIEDAHVVAACLASVNPVEQAFRQYETIRKAKADRVVQLSRRIGQAVNLPGWLKPVAFAAMRAIPAFISAGQFNGIYDMAYAQHLSATAFQCRPAGAGPSVG